MNAPKVPVHCYSKDGVMRVQNVSDPVYAPNSKGGPAADAERHPLVEKWEASGEFVRAAYTKRKDDDDYLQARTLIRKVMDEDQRKRLVSNVVGHLSAGVSEVVHPRREPRSHDECEHQNQERQRKAMTDPFED